MASVTEASAGAASGTRAGFFIRLAGFLVDGIILGIVGTVLDVALKGAAGSILSLLVGLLYYTLLVGGWGQTIGMSAAKVRVIDKNGGGNIGYLRAFVRWIGMYISAASSSSATSGCSGTAKTSAGTTRWPTTWSCAPEDSPRRRSAPPG